MLNIEFIFFPHQIQVVEERESKEAKATRILDFGKCKGLSSSTASLFKDCKRNTRDTIVSTTWEENEEEEEKSCKLHPGTVMQAHPAFDCEGFPFYYEK